MDTSAAPSDLFSQARAGHLQHEQRYDAPGSIGVAAWPLHRLVGVRAADASAPAVLQSKPMWLPDAASKRMLLLNADVPGHTECPPELNGGCGTAGDASLLVEMLVLDAGPARLVWRSTGQASSVKLKAGTSATCIPIDLGGPQATHSTSTSRKRGTRKLRETDKPAARGSLLQRRLLTKGRGRDHGSRDHGSRDHGSRGAARSGGATEYATSANPDSVVVRLRFTLTGEAKLFAFRFAGPVKAGADPCAPEATTK
jgi:hypothetical protein